MPILDRLLTKAEVAGLLKLSVRTIERMIASREIPSVKIRGCRRVPEAVVRALMASGDRPEEPRELAQPVTPTVDRFARVTCPACRRPGMLPLGAFAVRGLLECRACGHRHSG